MSRAQKRGFHFTTILLLMVIAAMVTGIFVQVTEPVAFDWDAAAGAVDIYFHNVRRECALRGVDQGYEGEVLYVDRSYTKNGTRYTLTDIYENVLAGTNIRHVKLSKIPENVHPDAFAGTEGVIVYTDQEITGDMTWAQYVTIRPSEDFKKVSDPGPSYRLVFTWAQAKNFVKNWAGDEKVMLGTTLIPALAMLLICALRQWCGRGNPLWPVFRSGLGKGLFVAFSYAAGILTALTLFCEEADVGVDVYGVVEFLLGWPVKALAVIGGLFLLSDLLRRDFPWFAARWVVRIAITLLVVMFCAAVGWVAAVIVTENLGLFKTLYILGLVLFVSLFVGGSGKVDSSIQKGMESSFVTSESGAHMRVDHYSHGTYVGNDQIVGFGSDTMTGESGQVYKKY